MKFSLFVAAALAASIEAAVLEKRQLGGYPDGKFNCNSHSPEYHYECDIES
jgi:hypothetical protein